jgi:uncharacterized membrane protein YkvA (DUF1232 family)
VNTLLVALLVTVGVWLIAVLILIILGKRSHAQQMLRLFPHLLMLFRGLLTDPRVSRPSKVLLALATLWIASPIDLIPEFIPVVGPLDDAIVAGLVLRHIVKRTDRSVLLEHWRGDAAALDWIIRSRTS